jgi:ABC-type amino acid transport substrate-binding protein
MEGESSNGKRPAAEASGVSYLVALVFAGALMIAIVAWVTIRGGADEPLEPILLSTGEWAPYSGEKLVSNGVASAVVTAVLQQIGYKPEFRFMPWSRAEQAALANDTNRGVRATFPYALNPERSANFYFSKPIFNIELSVFFNGERNPAGASINKADDLRRFSIVAISGYRYPVDVERFMSGATSAETNVAAFRQLLTSDKPLVVVEATRVGEDLLRGELATDAAAIQVAPLHFTSPIHLMASKRNPNNSSLIRQFDAALAEMQRSDALAQIEQQTLGAIDEQNTVLLQPLVPTGTIEATTGGEEDESILLPRGTRAVVERWSRNYLEPKRTRPDAAERVRVRILNGPQRGQRLFVDERTIVLP